MGPRQSGIFPDRRSSGEIVCDNELPARDRSREGPFERQRHRVVLSRNASVDGEFDGRFRRNMAARLGID